MFSFNQIKESELGSLDGKNILVARLDSDKLIAVLLDDSSHKDALTNFVTLD